MKRNTDEKFVDYQKRRRLDRLVTEMVLGGTFKQTEKQIQNGEPKVYAMQSYYAQKAQKEGLND